MAALSSCLPLTGVEGTTTRMPGMLVNHVSSDWECWAAPCFIRPSGARSTSDMVACPPNM